MTKIEALKELENQAETLQKALGEIRALIVAEYPQSKPKPIGVPLREAPKYKTEYWLILDYDGKYLASGCAHATKYDAEFAAKRRAISSPLIGEYGL